MTKMELDITRKRALKLDTLKRTLAWEIAADLCPVQDLGDEWQDDKVREETMVDELSMLMERVLEARHEYKKAEEVFATNLPALTQQLFICKQCGNRNTNNTFLDPRTGDTVCRGINNDDNCGEILQDHQINRGAAKRNFEDVEDKNHHGPSSDPLMPDSVNMRTQFITSAAGRPGKDPHATKLSQISRNAEMDLSNIGNDGRASTRTGYKTQQKLEAFNIMADFAIKYGIHDAVIEAAKEEFAKFREVKERVEKFKGVLCACILLAFDEVGHEADSRTSYNSIRGRDGLTNSGESSYQPTRSETDVALTILEGKRFGTWSLEEATQWLREVADKDKTAKALKEGRMTSTIVNYVVDHISTTMDNAKRVLNGDIGIAEKVANIPDMNIFGTTTSAKRATNASIARGNGKAATVTTKNLTAGQRLMRLKGKIHTIVETKEGKPATEKQLSVCTAVLDACIERRLKYEASVLELEELAKKEAQRLVTEETMNRKGDSMREYLAEYSSRLLGDEDEEKGKKSSSSSSSSSSNNGKKGGGSGKIKKEEEDAAPEGDADDILAELLGDDMPLVTSSGFDNVAEVEKKTETKPTRGKKREKREALASPNVPSAKRVKIESDRDEPAIMPAFTIVSGRQ